MNPTLKTKTNKKMTSGFVQKREELKTKDAYRSANVSSHKTTGNSTPKIKLSKRVTGRLNQVKPPESRAAADRGPES